MLKGRKIKVIGLGGIGAAVVPSLIQYLSSLRCGCPVWLIDGDTYEESNRARVRFDSYGNKAIVQATQLEPTVQGLTLVPVPRYVNPGNVARVVQERDVVLLCVDNHATRRCVSNRCGRLSDVLLVSGGNDGVEEGREGTFGKVQLYRREGGRDRTNPLTRFHTELANPADRRPDQLGCAELAQSSAPQLLFTNLAVASAMLNALFGWLRGRLEYEEVFLDILQARMTSALRPIGAESRRGALRSWVDWPAPSCVAPYPKASGAAIKVQGCFFGGPPRRQPFACDGGGAEPERGAGRSRRSPQRRRARLGPRAVQRSSALFSNLAQKRRVP